MTIRLLAKYRHYPIGSIVTLDAGTEAGLVAAKLADANLASGVPYVAPVVPNQRYPAQVEVDSTSGNVTGIVNPKTGDALPLGSGGAELNVTGSQVVGGVLTAAYSKGGGTIVFTRTPAAGGSSVDIGTALSSGGTYTVQTSDRGYVIGARPATYLPPAAAGVAIPTVAPLAPTITNFASNAPGTVTATFTRNADNGGDSVIGDRLHVFNAGTNMEMKSADGTSPITANGIPDGIPLYGRVGTIGATNGEGPLSTKSGNITLNSGGGGTVPIPTSVGPYTLGNSYALGPNQYVATTGDDFSQLSYVSPANVDGRYSTTRAYMSPVSGNGPRGNTNGSNTLIGYDVDPLHTGHSDANKGVAMTSVSDTMGVSNGRLQLKSRIATPAEKALSTNAMPVMSAMINTSTSHLVMAPFFVECKMKLTKAQASMAGWHPSFWMMQAKSVTSWTSTELDWESNSTKIAPNIFKWTNGSNTSLGGTGQTWTSGTEYTFRIEVLVDGSVTFWSNISAGGGTGALNQVRSLAAGNVADTSRPFYVLLTNHVANFPDDPYAASDWVAAGTTGAVMDIDYFALLTSAGTLYQPQIATRSYNFDYGAPISIPLPDAATVWGNGSVTEDIESWAQESNEPGGDYAGGYLNKVYGLTYDLSALTISGTPTAPTNKPGTNKSGRIMVCRYTKMLGTACVPHRTVINIGPHLAVDALPFATVGQPYQYDLYAQADCGVLTSNAQGQRAKTVVVSGLPAGLTYNDTTGLITGTPTQAFANILTVTTTNSVGQTSTANPVLSGFAQNQGAAAPTITGAPALRNSWDFDNLASLTIDSGTGAITSVAPVDGGTLALTNATPAAAPTRVLRQNNRYAALFNKANNQYLQGSAAQAAGGTQVVVFEHVSTTAAMQLLDRGRSTAGTLASREGLLSIQNGGLSQRRCTNGATAVDATSTQNPTATIRVAVLVFDPAGTGFTMYLDGASTGFTNSTTLPTGMDTVTLGGRFSSAGIGLPYDGYIYRVLDYQSAFTAAQAEEVAVWARKQYGTPNLA